MQKKELIELILQYEKMELDNTIGTVIFDNMVERWFRNFYCKKSKHPHFVVSVGDFMVDDIIQREGRLLVVAYKRNISNGIYIFVRSMYTWFSFHLILQLYIYCESHYYEQIWR